MKMKTNIDEYVIQVISNEQGLPNIDFEMKYKVKKDKSFYYYFFLLLFNTHSFTTEQKTYKNTMAKKESRRTRV